MKHTGLVLIALILVGGLVFAAGCIAAPQTQSLEGKWILTGIGSGSNAEHPNGIISMEIVGTNVSGNAGVNLYHGTFSVENGKLIFSPMATTRMAGPEHMMAQEQNFLAALLNVTGYTVANGVVTFTDASGNTLLTFAAMPAETLDGTSWTLADNSKVTLEFTNGAFSGKAPINNYFGSCFVTGTNGITFGNAGTTLMAGPEDQMKAETEFFAALNNVTGYKIADGKLLLTDKDGKTLLTFNEAALQQAGSLISGNWTLSTDKGITLDITADGVFNGQAPVNLYFGTASITDGSISFGPVGATKMAGPEDQMKAETEFFAALDNVTGYKVGEGMLEFTDKDGKTLLTFVRPVDTQTPAAKALPGAEKTGLVNEWVLEGNSDVTLNLTADGSFNGQAPVNLYFGSYTETADGLTFSAVGSTMMAGPEDAMNAESKFYEALGTVAGYKVVDGKLILTDAAGNTVLTFA
ncbi:MAG TPA: META domain-containing protein [Methanocorpusculum sp.]|nr:META domain-containing protein [Methanocorpusculum sp.]HJK81065.1 META domain-containing protein [Methanocorpusculum sp.]